MTQSMPEDRFGIPFVEDGLFSYFPGNPERLRPVRNSRRIGQAILSASREPLGEILCDLDYRHYQIHSHLCGRECFLPEFVKQLLAGNMVPIAIVEPGVNPYVVDYNAILGISDSGNFLNPCLLHGDIYDKIVISETPSLDGVELQDTTRGMTEALMECAPETQVVMLDYLVCNLDESDSFEIFHGLVLRSCRASLERLANISNQQLGAGHKLSKLLQISLNGTKPAVVA